MDYLSDDKLVRACVSTPGQPVVFHDLKNLEKSDQKSSVYFIFILFYFILFYLSLCHLILVQLILVFNLI